MRPRNTITCWGVIQETDNLGGQIESFYVIGEYYCTVKHSNSVPGPGLDMKTVPTLIFKIDRRVGDDVMKTGIVYFRGGHFRVNNVLVNDYTFDLVCYENGGENHP